MRHAAPSPDGDVDLVLPTDRAVIAPVMQGTIHAGLVVCSLTVDPDTARDLWAQLGRALAAIDDGPDPNGEPPG